MHAQSEIEAGICGFKTVCNAQSEDSQNVTFEITSGCEKIRAFGQALCALGPVDGFQEISAQGESVVLGTARSSLKGCCAGCVVPPAVFKTMQVAAGLALPKDIAVKLTKSE
jgi:hypothetical protein